MARAVPAYNELQLRLAPGPEGRYEVLAVAGGGATAYGSFAVPFSAEGLENFRYAVDPATARTVRGARAPRHDRAKQFGTQLFEALTADEAVRSVYATARQDAERVGRGLRITLYLTRTPELAEVPWEFLYNRPDFLAQSVWTPVVRYLDLPRPPRPLWVEPPLRILGMVSRPRDGEFAELDTNQERENLERALADLTAAGRVEVRWLEHATLRDLQREVAHGDDFHVFHYIGHGEYDERAEEGFLVLERPDGRAVSVSGERLGTLLGDHRSLRLAVLNACDVAKTASHDSLGGVAANLIERGVPAVVGMQFAITDQAAIDFGEEFYATLAEGYPVDAAVTEARRAMATNDEIEWGTPVLFMRVADGRLFDVAGTAVHGLGDDLAPGTTELAVAAPPGAAASAAASGVEPGLAAPEVEPTSAPSEVERVPARPDPGPTPAASEPLAPSAPGGASAPPLGSGPPEGPPPGRGPPPSTPGPEGEPERGAGRRLAVGVALLAVAALVVGLVIALSGGGGDHPAATTSGSASLPSDVRRLGGIVEFFKVGKAISLRGHYGAAVANRQQVLDRLAAFRAPPQLRPAAATLRRMTGYALAYNKLKVRGEDERAKVPNNAHNDLRNRFVSQFNPYARQFHVRTYRQPEL